MITKDNKRLRVSLSIIWLCSHNPFRTKTYKLDFKKPRHLSDAGVLNGIRSGTNRGSNQHPTVEFALDLFLFCADHSWRVEIEIPRPPRERSQVFSPNHPLLPCRN